MKHAALIALIMTAVSSVGRADEEYVHKLTRSPWLSPEMCAELPPDTLFKIRISDSPRKMEEINGSEAGQDAFFEAYEENLTTYTNRHYPMAKKVRDNLYAAFDQIFQFISDSNDHSGVRHYSTRLPARVEWRIFHGLKNNFNFGVGRYSIDDIRAVAKIYQHAQTFGEPYKEAIALANQELDAGLKNLNKAEAILPEDAAYYFRAEIMGMFGEFIGR